MTLSARELARRAAAALRLLEGLQSPAQLLARLYVAQVFLLAGLTKIRDWETTLLLFEDEYQVPLLSPAVAALAGTAGELVLPVLLALGLGGRFAALGLSVVNLVAVASVPEMPPAALQQHVFWGSLLAFLALWGAGAWSIDRLIADRLRPWLSRTTPTTGAGYTGRAESH